jgi:hypothetical protein
MKTKTSTAGNVLSALKNRTNISEPKKGVNLLNIVQKLTEKRAGLMDTQVEEGDKGGDKKSK